MKIKRSQINQLVLIEGCGCQGSCKKCSASPAIGMYHSLGLGRSNEEMRQTVDSYQVVRSFLDKNPDLVDMAVEELMRMSGSTCPKSTKRAVADHMSEMNHEPSISFMIKEGVSSLVDHTVPRYAGIFKASDEMFYMDLADKEAGSWEDSTTYGPFEDRVSARTFLNENFDYPGDVFYDSSESLRPPRISPNGLSVVDPGEI